MHLLVFCRPAHHHSIALKPGYFPMLRHATGGNPKTGAFRAQFLLESVLDLKRQLRALGSDLVIAMGRPEEVGGQGLVAGLLSLMHWLLSHLLGSDLVIAMGRPEGVGGRGFVLQLTAAGMAMACRPVPRPDGCNRDAAKYCWRPVLLDLLLADMCWAQLWRAGLLRLPLPTWRAVLPSLYLQVLPGLVTERGSGSRTTVIAQSEVTSEETGVERKVRNELNSCASAADNGVPCRGPVSCIMLWLVAAACCTAGSPAGAHCFAFHAFNPAFALILV